jgi:hypothetical protein
LFRVFGFVGAFALLVVLAGFVAPAVGVVVVAFGVVTTVDDAGVVVVLFVAGGTAAPVADVEPEELMLPDAGVAVLGVVAGREVSGVGSGGNGFDMMPAIISFRPASD